MGKEQWQPVSEEKNQGDSNERKEYATQSGFLGNVLDCRLIPSEKSEQDELFLKFTLGTEGKDGAVSWLKVALRGKAAERFSELLPSLKERKGRKYLSVRGIYQERTTPQGKKTRELWAFQVKPASEEERYSH